MLTHLPFFLSDHTKPFQRTSSERPPLRPKVVHGTTMLHWPTATALPHQQPHTSGIQGAQREDCPRPVMSKRDFEVMNLGEHQELRRMY
jgi:hypothetical protein